MKKILLTVAVLMCVLLPVNGYAADWSGTTNSVWATDTNWSTGSAPADNDPANFFNNGNGNTTLDVSGANKIGLVDFSNASGTIAAYTIGSGGAGAQNFTFYNGGGVTVENNVFGAQTFNANLILGNDGTTQTFTFTNNSGLGTVLYLLGGISGSTGAGVKTLAVTGSANTTIGGAISDGTTGSVAVNKTGAGILTLSGTSTYTGATTVSGGTLIAAGNAAALGAGTLTMSGGKLQLADNTGLNFGRNTTVSSSSEIDSGRMAGAGAGTTNTLGTLSINGSTLTVGLGDALTTSGTQGLTFGDVTLTGNATITTASTAATTGLLTLGAVTGGSRNFTITGTEATTITGAINISSGSDNGGAVSVTQDGAININSTILTTGGNRSDSLDPVTGGTGGAVSINSTADTVTVAGDITTRGGQGASTGNTGTGGASGTVTIHAGTTAVVGNITTTGGEGASTSGAAVGGAAGAVDITADTSITLNGNINAVGGPTEITVGPTTQGNGANVHLHGSTILGSDITINTSGTTGGEILFANTLNGTTDSTEDLSLTAGNGNVTFTGAVGGTTDLGAILISSAATTEFTSTVAAASLHQDAGTTTTLRDNVTTTTATGVDITATNITLDGLTIDTSTGNGVARFNGATTLSSGAVGITGGTGAINFTGAVATGGQILTITNAATGSATISGAVSGTGGLVKDGAGALHLDGNNTFTTGGVTLNAGTLNLGSTTALGAAGSTFTINGGTIDADAGALVMANNNPIDINSDFTFTGTNNLNLGTGGVDVGNALRVISISNAKTLTLGGVITGTGVGGIHRSGGSASGELVLSGNNVHTGKTMVTSGILTLSGDNSGASGGVTINGGTLNINSATALGTGDFIINGGTIDNTSAGDITLTTANSQSWAGNFTYTGSAHSLNLGTGGVMLMSGNRTVTVSGNTLTVGGGINGGWGIVKDGAGTLVLSGASTYNGVTTVNAGTLQAGIITSAFGDNSAVTLANVATALLDLNDFSNTIGSLNGGGALGGNVDLGSGTLTTGGLNTADVYEGVIFGTGGLTKTGTNELALTGSNLYTGTTTINAGGKLTLNAAGTIATSSGVANAGTFTIAGNKTVQALTGAGATELGANTLTIGDANNRSGTYTGAASGTGGITADGTGTLTLGGVNTYTGATTINAGSKLTLNAAGTIATSSGVANAGTFTIQADKTIQALTGAGATALGANTLTIGDANNRSCTYDGVIGGTGGITKAGTGTLTLTGANAYTGTTTLNAGTVQATSATALGAGNVVHNAATLDIGANSLNIGGTYAQSGASTLMVAINGTAHGMITAGGVCTVNATDSLVLAVSNYIPNNTTYTIIDGAVGGAIVAPTITVTGDNRATFTATTVGDDLILTSSRTANGFASDATPGDSNARAIGTVLDTITNPTADMSNILTTMEGLSNSQVASALDTMVPQVDAGIINTSTAVLNNFVGASMERVEKLLTVAQGTPSAATGISTGDEGNLNGIWGKGYGSYLTQGTRNNISGYDAWNAGTALGVDHLFGDSFTLGISGGYAYGNVDSDSNNANTYINSAQTTIYGGYADPNIPYFIDAAGSFAYNWYNGQRDINVGGTLLRTANAEYGGQQYGVYLGGGYKINITKNIEFTPLVSLQWNHLRMNSYTETEAGALGLNVSSQSYDQLQSGLGARIASPMHFGWGTFTPEAHGKWLYDFIGDPVAMTSNFNGGGAAFGSNGCKPALNSFNAGAQMVFDFKNDISFIANCDTEMKDEFFGIYGSAAVRYSF